MYQEELMDHFKYPRNRKKITKPDFSAGELNPSCGDQISIEGTIIDQKIADLGFNGKGCVISQAAASMLTEIAIDKSINEALLLSKDDITKLIGIELGPTRLRCALLCLHVLHQGLKGYLEKQHTS